MDSLTVGLVDEDKVCENCGQIFSCEAAFLEHRKRNSCATSRELLIDTPKGLRCPIQGCQINATDYEAIHRHHEAVKIFIFFAFSIMPLSCFQRLFYSRSTKKLKMRTLR